MIVDEHVGDFIRDHHLSNDKAVLLREGGHAIEVIQSPCIPHQEEAAFREGKGADLVKGHMFLTALLHAPVGKVRIIQNTRNQVIVPPGAVGQTVRIGPAEAIAAVGRYNLRRAVSKRVLGKIIDREGQFNPLPSCQRPGGDAYNVISAQQVGHGEIPFCPVIAGHNGIAILPKGIAPQAGCLFHSQ